MKVKICLWPCGSCELEYDWGTPNGKKQFIVEDYISHITHEHDDNCSNFFEGNM